MQFFQVEGFLSVSRMAICTAVGNNKIHEQTGTRKVFSFFGFQAFTIQNLRLIGIPSKT